MKVLITGAAGQVGVSLVRSAPSWVELTALGSGKLDISDEAAVKATLGRLQPELIINAAAYTAVDRAETDTQRAFEVNGLAPAYLGAAASDLGIPVFHISTDYVFSGKAETPYDENAVPDPQTAYGRGKLAGELGLASQCADHLILRTSWVFSAEGSNFVKTMLRLGRERPQLKVVADQIGGPTPASAIAEALWRLAARWNEMGSTSFEWGTYHFSGAPSVSWHGFASDIMRQAQATGTLAKPPVVEAITTLDFPTPAQRPAYSVLDCSRLLAKHGIEQPDWRKGMIEVLHELAGES